jgi:hypothetical protein
VFGDVGVKTFTAAFFDAQRDAARSLESADEAAFVTTIDRFQAKLQGMAAAVMRVTAEPKRAYEIANDGTEKVVAIMRYFSRAAFIPNVTSCCVPFGQAEPRSSLLFALRAGILCTFHDGVSDQDGGPWYVSQQELQLWGDSGITALIALVFKQKRSRFEDAVFNSFMLYSRSMLARTVGDKLMYVCSALESLLLRDENEPIQQNVADRLAYTIKSDKHERMKVVKNFKAVYGLRSKFVHHAEDVDDHTLLIEFLQNVWAFYLCVIHRHLAMKSKDDFLRMLDELKYA